MTFETALDFILLHEGGYSNDPKDPGGETNFGISKRAYPDGVDLLTFDTAVNQGSSTAVRILQQSVKTPVDGVIGPATIAAAQSHPGPATIKEYIAQRSLHYAQNTNISHYGLGWYRRLADAAELAFKGVA